MADLCASCLVNFLDLDAISGSIRDMLQAPLQFAQGLPTDQFQAQLDAFSSELDAVGESLAAYTDNIDLTSDLISTIQGAMIDNNIDPGDCPELDALTQMLGGLNDATKSFLANPLDKVVGTLSLGAGELSTSVAIFNTLTAQAGEFSLC